MDLSDDDTKLLCRLATLIRNNGEQLLNGTCRLSLTSLSISLLNNGFSVITDGDLTSSFDVTRSNCAILSTHADVQMLYDFIQKIPRLKIFHGNGNMRNRASIAPFRGVKELEIKKVPLHLIQGINKLRNKLETIVCELFESCGSDRTSPLSWSALSRVTISHNNLDHLDESLREFDSSHNNIEDTGQFLEYLTELCGLNMGYNCLSTVPSLSLSSHRRLTVLIVRHNQIENIDGIIRLINLAHLDLGYNLLSDHAILRPLRELEKLEVLLLRGNPLVQHKKHRARTAYYINAAIRDLISVDGAPFTKTDISEGIKYGPVTTSRGLQRRLSDITAPSQEPGYSSLEQSTDASEFTQGGRRDRRGRTRVRTAMITDPEDSLAEEPLIEPLPATTPHDDEAETVRQRVEQTRGLLGPGWLQSLAHTPEQAAGTSQAGGVDNPALQPDEPAPDHVPVASAHKSSSSIEVIADETLLKELVTSSPPEPLSPSDVYSGQPDHAHTEENYGDESEPWIVTEENSAEEFLITVTERYLLEKNLNGDVMAALDLKSLESVHLPEISKAPAVHITFAYVRRDWQERRYFMESNNDATQLLAILRPIAEQRAFSVLTTTQFQCLKCNTVFAGDPVTDNRKTRSSSAAKQCCPHCRSELVIVVETADTASTNRTPYGSVRSGNQSPGDSRSQTPSLKRNDDSFYSLPETTGSFKSATSQRTTPFTSPSPVSCSDEAERSVTNESKTRRTLFGDSDVTLSETDTTKSSSDASFSAQRDVTALRDPTEGLAQPTSQASTTDSEISIRTNPSRSSIAVVEPDGDADEICDVTDRVCSMDETTLREELSPVGSINSRTLASMVSSVYEASLHGDGDTHSPRTPKKSTPRKCEPEPAAEEVTTATDVTCSVTSGASFISAGRGTPTSSAASDETTPRKEAPSDSRDRELINEITIYFDDFTDVDHRLKLYLSTRHYGDREDTLLLLRADALQYRRKDTLDMLLVMSTIKVYILRIVSLEHMDALDKCFRLIGSYKLTDLQLVEIGLGHQSLRFEFGTESSCFEFLLRDDSRCKKFVSQFTRVLQNSASNSFNSLQAISKNNPITQENIEKELLISDAVDHQDVDTNVVKAVIGYVHTSQVNAHGARSPSSVVILMTSSHVCVAKQNHMYFPPRCLSKPTSKSEEKQFDLKDKQTLTDLISMTCYEDDPLRLGLFFSDEQSGAQTAWSLSLGTAASARSLRDALTTVWERQFGVSLQVDTAPSAPQDR